MWRPEGWEKRDRYGTTVNNIDLDSIYEAGADAILKALTYHCGEIRVIKSGDKPWTKIPEFSIPNKDGWVVFIPDE